ncbi:MAG: hypothetical protein L6Q97_22340 [Thermoanaerobaculia bacterium]|nr:hypothetical protein [Thermoanaerobaculia bacterium]
METENPQPEKNKTKKEMLVAWRVSGETGRRDLAEKHKITITREDGRI